MRLIDEICQTFNNLQTKSTYVYTFDLIDRFKSNILNQMSIEFIVDWLPGVNGRQLTNGLPVWVRGHEQTGVKPRKLQSALTPVVNKSSNTIRTWWNDVELR